ncbi:MAG TPA: hypothetical protein VN648_02020, partial [Candidatus Methylomirabilis sp.]|nr:hypothetical protein [Candidatus Methylomirabilis sp.]
MPHRWICPWLPATVPGPRSAPAHPGPEGCLVLDSRLMIGFNAIGHSPHVPRQLGIGGPGEGGIGRALTAIDQTDVLAYSG